MLALKQRSTTATLQYGVLLSKEQGKAALGVCSAFNPLSIGFEVLHIPRHLRPALRNELGFQSSRYVQGCLSSSVAIGR